MLNNAQDEALRFTVLLLKKLDKLGLTTRKVEKEMKIANGFLSSRKWSIELPRRTFTLGQFFVGIYYVNRFYRRYKSAAELEEWHQWLEREFGKLIRKL